MFAERWESAIGLDLHKGLAAAGWFGNDGIDGRSPDASLGKFPELRITVKAVIGPAKAG
jgi:hypothetical protein